MVQEGLSISLPYPEAATMALARQASHDNALDVLYCPHYGLARSVQRLSEKLGQTNLSGRLGRSEETIPEMRPLGPLASQVRYGVRLTKSQGISRRWMHHWAGRFDKLVAERMVSLAWSGSHIGLPGASLRAFQANATGSGRNVLQAVNSHPAAHNALLASHYPDANVHHELVPKHILDRQLIEFSMADLVLVPSNTTARQMIEYGVDEERVHVVPYGFRTSTLPSPGAPTTAAPYRKRPQIVFVGQLGYIKGVPHLLKAVSGLPVDLHLYGPLVSRSVMQRLPLNAEYKGIATRQELSKAYRLADALVLPSIMDTFAFVVAEAVSSGLPVVLSDSVGARELLTDQDCRIFPTGDVGSLREELRNVDVLSDARRTERSARVLLGQAAGNALQDSSYGFRAIRVLGSTSPQGS